ncbi:MAG TPA: glycosyltransferase family 39 protein, partial [Sumerlaeia bacterium]|nr:glycosyltransferase family 39 protein [Sumerlaeia bacterium]
MSPSCSKPPFPWGMALGFTALAAFLRFAALGQEALFLDERLTIDTATIPAFSEFLRAFLHRDPHPPLYFLLMRWWIRLFGVGHIALRFPSALFGALTVPVVMRALYESRCATRLSLIAVGSLASVCPFHIYYSQEARPYAMQVLFFALNLLYAVRIWVDTRPLPRRSDLAALLLTAALAICT